MNLNREQHFAKAALGAPIDQSGKDTSGFFLALIAHDTAFRLMERGSFSEQMASYPAERPMSLVKEMKAQASVQ